MSNIKFISDAFAGASNIYLVEVDGEKKIFKWGKYTGNKHKNHDLIVAFNEVFSIKLANYLDVFKVPIEADLVKVKLSLDLYGKGCLYRDYTVIVMMDYVENVKRMMSASATKEDVDKLSLRLREQERMLLLFDFIVANGDRGILYHPDGKVNNIFVLKSDIVPMDFNASRLITHPKHFQNKLDYLKGEIERGNLYVKTLLEKFLSTCNEDFVKIKEEIFIGIELTDAEKEELDSYFKTVLKRFNEKRKILYKLE